MRKCWLIATGALLVMLPAADAHAQARPPGFFLRNPHPTMPWSFYGPNVGAWDYGTVVQYLSVPPQQVVIQVPVQLPEGVPPQTQEQTVEIPGYYITETTTGFYYPERWTLQQSGAGVYQWIPLPAEFRRKAVVESRPPATLR